MKIISACELCGDGTSRSISLCHACQDDLPVLQHCCKRCSIELGTAKPTNSLCGQCLQNPPAVDHALSLFHYDPPIDYMVSELKFNHRLSYASIFGTLLAEKILSSECSAPDVIVPVPLHSKRLVERGFNQSLEIAKSLSKKLNIPVNISLVKRVKHTLAQSELSAKDRRKNIQGCFEVMKLLNYKHIVIIDDVVTTGSTSNELASLLKKNGVEKVSVWSIARAVLN